MSSTDYQRILADFLVIASRLILIKSRSLLPNLVLSREEEGDIKELEERLKIYQQIKIWGRELGKWAKGQPLYLSRESYFNLPTIFYPPKHIYPDNLTSIELQTIRLLDECLHANNPFSLRDIAHELGYNVKSVQKIVGKIAGKFSGIPSKKLLVP